MPLGHTVKTMSSAGMLNPGLLLNLGRAQRKWGLTSAVGFAAGANRHPDKVALIDELGELSYAEVHDRTNRLANALMEQGVRPGQGVGVMCRDHRGFIDATVALSKIGADTLFLNTGFAAPQLADVMKREEAVALVYDHEFEKLLSKVECERRFVAWVDEGGTSDAPTDPTLDSLIEKGDPAEPDKPAEEGRIVILTSGTTGTPKGAPRKAVKGIGPLVSFLSKIPLRAGERTHIAAPLFHSWGMAHFTIAQGLGSTISIRRKFDPEKTLEAIDRYKPTALAVVPVMLQRILELPDDVRGKYDTSSLRVIAASGSALTGKLATRVMDEFGDILYNLYGSTEVAVATVAMPEDMRAAPDTAGKPPVGTTVKIFDENGKELPTGETGRIFVGNEMMFEGYTGGGNKEVIEGLMSSGDVGHFDENGRLFVEGRDDEMIVSGGENVFPAEVEELLGAHEAVAEVAVIGVDDEQFGKRLKAFCVVRDGASLTEDDVKGYVKEHLARYKVPRDVEFLDELPRNTTGKILKRELIEREKEAAS
jgi:acyl-CoA synthetase (AMP-forming)/AMP-acid ligase II